MDRISHSKKGSTAVFLMLILAGVLAAAAAFIHAASEKAERSYADAVFDLAGRSVLSEYDLELRTRYGIFAVRMDERQAEEKIRRYADYSFHGNLLKEMLRGRDYMEALKPRLSVVKVDLKGYSITDADLFEEQVVEEMKYGIVRNLFQGGTDSEAGSSSAGGEHAVLRNEQLINGLPSKGYQSSLLSDLKQLAENGLPSLGEIKEKFKNTYLTNEYILSHFYHCRQRGGENRDSFFTNEVEYILKGHYDDEQNRKGVRTDLFIIRNVLNLTHIKQDTGKWAKVEAAAAILTLVKGEKIGELVVAEAWAAAESENDLRLLLDGKQVPLIKKQENWAVPLSSTLEYLWKDDYYTPEKTGGYDYADYLRLLLFLENREKKLLRCMDLIQLNLKGSYNGNFNLKEYYGGFQFEAVVQGRTYAYTETF